VDEWNCSSMVSVKSSAHINAEHGAGSGNGADARLLNLGPSGSRRSDQRRQVDYPL